MPELSFVNDYWSGCFDAMAGSCEVLVDTSDEETARRAVDEAAAEALRVERKYSRYRDDNIIHRINNSQGEFVEVDAETAHLLEFAVSCHRLSDGAFDITSGVLRALWNFDGGDRIPSREDVARLLPRIGWEKVEWQAPRISVPPGMEIDLGGFGKEYAVDGAVALVKEATQCSVLVNFGGDLAASGPRANGDAWRVGIENPTPGMKPVRFIELRRGGLATSGDARRYLSKDGVRYGHVLDPRSGWPVEDAPRSVTVVADSCTEAGLFATLAMLHGRQAERFLDTQSLKYWCVR